AGGLAGTLQTNDQHHGRRLVCKAEPRGMAAEHLSELVTDDLDNLLAGRERGEHIFAHCLLFNLLDELLDNFEMNVGLEQGDADLTKRLLHVRGRQLPFPAKVLEDSLQL